MDDKNQGFWEKFEDYVEETEGLLDSTISKMVKDITGEENQLLVAINRIISSTVINETRPLTFALATLETYYENTLWDESMKKEIVSFISIIEEHCENPDLRRHLPPKMLNFTYQTVYGYGERLAEFDVDQQQRIIKAIDSLHKYVVQLRRRC